MLDSRHRRTMEDTSMTDTTHHARDGREVKRASDHGFSKGNGGWIGGEPAFEVGFVWSGPLTGGVTHAIGYLWREPGQEWNTDNPGRKHSDAVATAVKALRGAVVIEEVPADEYRAFERSCSEALSDRRNKLNNTSDDGFPRDQQPPFGGK